MGYGDQKNASVGGPNGGILLRSLFTGESI
jgi:hypothetical protein